jgi:glycosyltransferase involved in cell wall biosynthesis
LRSWDVRSTRWVDEFAAISSAVQARIREFYGREARIIHPPVDTAYYTPSHPSGRGEFALAVSRMVPYKRLDLAIRACRALDYPLVIAGAGPDEPRLRALAERLGAAVGFVIEPSDERLRELYRRARVVVFPAEEDFGIVLAEAQACGTPVVALGRGGGVDIVVPGVTGVMVPAQDEASLRGGIEAALEADFDAGACRGNAERFSRERFLTDFLAWIGEAARRRGWDLEGVPAARAG